MQSFTVIFLLVALAATFIPKSTSFSLVPRKSAVAAVMWAGGPSQECQDAMLVLLEIKNNGITASVKKHGLAIFWAEKVKRDACKPTLTAMNLAQMAVNQGSGEVALATALLAATAAYEAVLAPAEDARITSINAADATYNIEMNALSATFSSGVDALNAQCGNVY